MQGHLNDVCLQFKNPPCNLTEACFDGPFIFAYKGPLLSYYRKMQFGWETKTRDMNKNYGNKERKTERLNNYRNNYIKTKRNTESSKEGKRGKSTAQHTKETTNEM